MLGNAISTEEVAAAGSANSSMGILWILFTCLVLAGYALRGVALKSQIFSRRLFWPGTIASQRPYVSEILIAAGLLWGAVVSVTWGFAICLGRGGREDLLVPSFVLSSLAVFFSVFTATNTYVLLRRRRRVLSSFQDLLFEVMTEGNTAFANGASDRSFWMLDFTPGVGSVSAPSQAFEQFRTWLLDVSHSPDVSLHILCFGDTEISNFHASLNHPELDQPIRRLISNIEQGNRAAVWRSSMVGASHAILVRSNRRQVLFEYVVAPAHGGVSNEIVGHVTEDAKQMEIIERAIRDQIDDAVTPIAVTVDERTSISKEAVGLRWREMDEPVEYPVCDDGDLLILLRYPQHRINQVTLYLSPTEEYGDRRFSEEADHIFTEPVHHARPTVDVIEHREYLIGLLVKKVDPDYTRMRARRSKYLLVRMQLEKANDMCSQVSNPVLVFNPDRFDAEIERATCGTKPIAAPGVGNSQA